MSDEATRLSPHNLSLYLSLSLSPHIPSRYTQIFASISQSEIASSALSQFIVHILGGREKLKECGGSQKQDTEHNLPQLKLSDPQNSEDEVVYMTKGGKWADSAL